MIAAAPRVIMGKDEINRTLKRLAHEIAEKNYGIKDLAVIGIQTGGVFLARRIVSELVKAEFIEKANEIPMGTLGITLYRDDVAGASNPLPVKETDIPFDIADKNIVLVDDVIFTGRTIRAAIDEIIDYGRPRSIQLAVLFDRGHRELPIEPNYVGKKFTTGRDQTIAVELVEVDGQDRVVLADAR